MSTRVDSMTANGVFIDPPSSPPCKLPSDILRMIFAIHDTDNNRKTLCSISRASKSFYEIAIPLLYRKITLTFRKSGALILPLCDGEKGWSSHHIGQECSRLLTKIIGGKVDKWDSVAVSELLREGSMPTEGNTLEHTKLDFIRRQASRAANLRHVEIFMLGSLPRLEECEAFDGFVSALSREVGPNLIPKLRGLCCLGELGKFRNDGLYIHIPVTPHISKLDPDFMSMAATFHATRDSITSTLVSALARATSSPTIDICFHDGLGPKDIHQDILRVSLDEFNNIDTVSLFEYRKVKEIWSIANPRVRRVRLALSEPCVSVVVFPGPTADMIDWEDTFGDLTSQGEDIFVQPVLKKMSDAKLGIQLAVKELFPMITEVIVPHFEGKGFVVEHGFESWVRDGIRRWKRSRSEMTHCVDIYSAILHFDQAGRPAQSGAIIRCVTCECGMKLVKIFLSLRSMLIIGKTRPRDVWPRYWGDSDGSEPCSPLGA